MLTFEYSGEISICKEIHCHVEQLTRLQMSK